MRINEFKPMTKKKKKLFSGQGAAFFFAVLLMTSGMDVSAEPSPCKPGFAQVASVEGRVEIKRASRRHWQPAQSELALCPGDSVRTGSNSRASVYLLEAQTTHRLDQQTTLTLTVSGPEKSFWLKLVEEAVYFFSRDPRQLTVETPYLNAAVEGTEFLVRVELEQASVWVFEGSVNAGNAAGRLLVGSGEAVSARPAEAPRRFLVAKPADAVQWALYYPPLIDYSAAYRGKTIREPGLEQALARQAQGDFPGALEALSRVPEARREAVFYTLQAALGLAVGRVDDARPALEAALRLDPHNGPAVALQAIIAITKNERAQALELALQAVAWTPDSAAAHIALSYAQQAVFRLPEAQASTRQAVAIAPNDALAWARLAELQLAVGDLAGGLNSARRSVALNPALGQTQTLMGFAYLTRIEIEQAQAAFNKAIRLDQAAPLPRLGLGLALIRRNRLEQGRREIEIAVGLDPNRSLLRSYLGKAYFEEKQNALADPQFTIAKGLDPNDPTPWFYDAIRKQSENRPVEALQDLQQSIDLNDNRAVYRSRQLLDQDLAARSASQGRIYQDLGFEQLALREGWSSVNVDPGNHSGHRLLADSYAGLPRHEIARSSELLQSQLLQPLNLTPIQPQLAVSSLSIFGGAGPSTLSLNEYNSLFVRDNLTLQANGLVGNRGTFGNDLVLAGLNGSFSYSLGQFHYETDGLRDNSDQMIDVYNAFVQFVPAHSTSVQAEYRYLDREWGEVNQKLDPEDFFEDFRQNDRSSMGRLGLRHDVSPHTTLLGSLVYKHDCSTTDVPLSIFDFSIASDAETYGLETQELFNFEQFYLVGGASLIDRNGKQITTITGPGSNNIEHLDLEAHYFNLYFYSYFYPHSSINLTIGASGDFIDSTFLDKNQFNPKLGLTWRLTEETTLRAAVFRNLQRLFEVSDQALEPTQIAGFAQFFDESDVTDSWTYGIAVDQKFLYSVNGGLAWSLRELDEPIVSVSGSRETQEVVLIDNKEQIGRAYLYWTPQPWLAFGAEYFYERLENDPRFVSSQTYTDLKTHHLRLSTRAFDRSGFSGGLITHYIQQSGVTQDDPTNPFERPPTITLREDFWVLDGFINYRLPKRWGIISLEVKNLLDKKFNYEERDPTNPVFYSERFVLGKLSLSF